MKFSAFLSRMSVLAALIVLVGSVQILAKTPGFVKDWGLTPSSTEAVILMQVPAFDFDYALSFSIDGKSGFMSRVYALRIPPFYNEKYVARSLKPGRYILTSISQQGQWGSCFANGTKVITVQPGRVYYLGTVNAGPLLAELQESAIARGKSRLSGGGLAVGWDHKVIPEWTISGSSEWDAARAYVRSKMPKTTAPIEQLTAEPAMLSVKPGEKTIQVCG